MIKKYFEDWSKFELLFLIFGLLSSIISAILKSKLHKINLFGSVSIANTLRYKGELR